MKNDRRKDIINRIKKRNKMKDHPVQNRREHNDIQGPTVTSYDLDAEKGHPLFRKDVWLLKVLIASLLFIAVAVIDRHPSNNLEPARSFISSTMETELQFALITDWYEETFGKPLAFFPSDKADSINDDVLQVSGDYILPVKGKIIEDYVTNGTGIVVQTDDDKSAYAVDEGTVVFAGVKEDYGNTIIIQHKDKSKSWYGRLDDIEVKVYSKVAKGEKLGSLNEEGTLFFGMEKDNRFVDPSQVISIE